MILELLNWVMLVLEVIRSWQMVVLRFVEMDWIYSFIHVMMGI